MKKPKEKEKISRSKTPKSEPLPNISERHPSWQIALLQMVNPWGWHILEKTKVAEIQTKLAEFEKKPWSEILGKNHKQNHKIKVIDLHNEAQKRLTDIGQDDIDKVVSLRLSGKERVYGILDGEVLRLLWWDPGHEICPSKKS